MILWIFLSVMTAIAALVILRPLMRQSSHDLSGYEQDLAVYKDQIREIDRDVARGVLPEDEAEGARGEIALRLLAADKLKDQKAIMEQGRRSWAAVFAVIVLPLVSLGTYLAVGQPGLPDQPLQARLDKPLDQQTLPEMVARVEAHLRNNPNDGQGWEVIGPVYMRVGRVDDAIQAYRRAVAILGEQPVSRLESWAEAIVVRDRGTVNPQARTIFLRAAELEPTTVKARFYLAMAEGQVGNRDEAIKAWTSLIDSANNPSEPWVAAAKSELAALQGNADSAAQDLANLPTAEQNELIASMVSGLASRLQEDGGSVEEWGRLMQSYVVLDQRENALKTLADARSAYKGRDQELEQITQIASALGLTE